MMGVHPWHDIPLPSNPGDWFPAFVEVPMGSNVKYELEKATGLLIVSRVLYSAVYYPANYGFVPRTWCDDGDPLDVLVLGQEPVVPQALLRAKLIGVMPMHDEKGRDDKLIAVHADDAEYRNYDDISELPSHRMLQLQRFFLDYKVLEGSEVTMGETQGRESALAVLRTAIEDYPPRRSQLVAQGPETFGKT